METDRPVRCSENEELVLYFLRKRKDMAGPNGLSENLDATFSKAYRSIYSAKTPIKTLKDLSQIKGVGKWILRLMQGFFPSPESETCPMGNLAKMGKKAKGPKRYLPQKNSAPYALLITLYRGMTNGISFMKRQELIDAAEASGLSRTSIGPEKAKGKPGQFGNSSRDWYTGWSCMKALISKGLVVKSNNPAKYMLTQEGQEAARECLLRSGLADSAENLTTTCGSLNSLDGQRGSHLDFSCVASDDNEAESPSADLSCQIEMNDCDRNFHCDVIDSSDSELAKPLEKDYPTTLTACTSINRDNRTNLISGDAPCCEVSGSTDSALCSFSLQACSSFIVQDLPVHKSSDVDAMERNVNALAMPPCRFGERFEETYDVILILDDREKFGSRSIKIVNNIWSQFKLPVERCGLRKLIYLVEGDLNKLEAAESIKSACFTTEILEGFDVQRTTGIADTVRMYGYLTQSINQYYRTYFSSDKVKSCKVCPSYDEFVKKCHDLEKITVSDVFALQLMQVPQVTEDVAHAVIDLYPTLLSLARAYLLLEGDVRAQEEMLKNQSKMITGAASRNIFKLVWHC